MDREGVLTAMLLYFKMSAFFIRSNWHRSLMKILIVVYTRRLDFISESLADILEEERKQ